MPNQVIRIFTIQLQFKTPNIHMYLVAEQCCCREHNILLKRIKKCEKGREHLRKHSQMQGKNTCFITTKTFSKMSKG